MARILGLVFISIAISAQLGCQLSGSDQSTVPEDLTSTTPPPPPVLEAVDVTGGEYLGGTGGIITLAYTDPENDLATACAVSNVDSSISIPQACSCDGSGVCTVSIVGNAGGLGGAQFDFTVDANGDTSTLGTVSLNLGCPGNYVIVPGNSALGTNSFCVMKYTARAWNDANADGVVDNAEVDADGCNEVACSSANWGLAANKPASIALNKPWRNLHRTNAKNECKSLGAKYDLIANPEWMTIARNIESVGFNWSSGISGTGMLVEGNGRAGGSVIGITDPTDPYDGTGSNGAMTAGGGWEHRRTTQLDNGSVIWDMSGNGWQWVDWAIGAALSNAPTCTTGGELTAANCANGWTNNDFQSSTGLLNSTNRAGKIVAGNLGGLRRGGQHSDDANGFLDGIYSLAVNRNNTFASASMLFRCVYRP